jgi:hypothetical protein
VKGAARKADQHVQLQRQRTYSVVRPLSDCGLIQGVQCSCGAQLDPLARFPRADS